MVYGHVSTLAGTLASQQSGQSVQLFATECGTTASKLVATVTTTTGGKFSYAATPLKQTAYTAKVKGSTSPAATVKVQPRLELRKVGRHRYAVRISAAQSFAGKVATFQRYSRATKRWVRVKRVLLKAKRERRRSDGRHVGEVPLEHQGEAARARHSRAEAGGPLLRRGSQHHDPRLMPARGRATSAP